MKLKSIICLLLFTTISFSLVGCGEEPKPPEPTPTEIATKYLNAEFTGHKSDAASCLDMNLISKSKRKSTSANLAETVKISKWKAASMGGVKNIKITKELHGKIKVKSGMADEVKITAQVTFKDNNQPPQERQIRLMHDTGLWKIDPSTVVLTKKEENQYYADIIQSYLQAIIDEDSDKYFDMIYAKDLHQSQKDKFINWVKTFFSVSNATFKAKGGITEVKVKDKKMSPDQKEIIAAIEIHTAKGEPEIRNSVLLKLVDNQWKIDEELIHKFQIGLQKECVKNMKAISNAVSAYNIDNLENPMKKLNLKVLTEKGYLKEFQPCPSGGKYTANNLEDSETINCSIHGEYDPNSI